VLISLWWRWEEGGLVNLLDKCVEGHDVQNGLVHFVGVLQMVSPLTALSVSSEQGSQITVDRFYSTLCLSVVGKTL
jgi:hypothetical protein